MCERRKNERNNSGLTSTYANDIRRNERAKKEETMYGKKVPRLRAARREDTPRDLHDGRWGRRSASGLDNKRRLVQIIPEHNIRNCTQHINSISSNPPTIPRQSQDHESTNSPSTRIIDVALVSYIANEHDGIKTPFEKESAIITDQNANVPSHM